MQYFEKYTQPTLFTLELVWFYTICCKFFLIENSLKILHLHMHTKNNTFFTVYNILLSSVLNETVTRKLERAHNLYNLTIHIQVLPRTPFWALSLSIEAWRAMKATWIFVVQKIVFFFFAEEHFFYLCGPFSKKLRLRSFFLFFSWVLY